jgi:hypothetical protein
VGVPKGTAAEVIDKLNREINAGIADPKVKWIKQHLRIKAFFGTSENAVKSQIWIAVSVYVLVAIVKKPATLYEILQIFSLSRFEKTPINCLFHDYPHQKIPAADPNQLTLFN